MNENLEPYEYKELPIESVEEDEEAEVRIRYDIADLVESIREIGQLSPGFAYKSGDKYKVFVGIRRLRAVKKLYEKEGKPNVFKAFVYEEKPKNFYELIRDENVKRADLSGIDKFHIIYKFSFAEKIIPVRDVKYIPSIRANLEQDPENDLRALAEEEHSAKEKGYDNHLSLLELLFLFRDLHSLEERKLFAIFFLVYRISLKRVLAENFKEFAIANAPKLSEEDLQIAGLSKEDVKKIIAIYKAPPYHSDIIQEAFEDQHKEEQKEPFTLETKEEKHLIPKEERTFTTEHPSLETKPEETFVHETEERHAEEQPSFVNEQPLEAEKSEEQHEKVEKLENEEVTSEISEEEPILIMDHDVEYESINGHRFMLVKKESEVQAVYVEDGQEIELAGKKVRIRYG